MEPKEWQKDVRGNQMEPKACKREPESVPTGAEWWLNYIPKSTSERGSPNCRFFGTPGFHDHPFWAQGSSKNASHNRCKNRCQKMYWIYENMFPKWCQNKVQNRWRIRDFFEPVISCVFVKSITLKSFFHMTRGTRIQSKINEKSM